VPWRTLTNTIAPDNSGTIFIFRPRAIRVQFRERLPRIFSHFLTKVCRAPVPVVLVSMRSEITLALNAGNESWALAGFWELPSARSACLVGFGKGGKMPVHLLGADRHSSGPSASRLSRRVVAARMITPRGRQASSAFSGRVEFPSLKGSIHSTSSVTLLTLPTTTAQLCAAVLRTRRAYPVSEPVAAFFARWVRRPTARRLKLRCSTTNPAERRQA
jgi:hypothetical protein